MVAEAADISKAAAGRAVDAVFDSISGSLKKGDSVTLVGFGTFSVSKRAARSGRNPRTGETIAGSILLGRCTRTAARARLRELELWEEAARPLTQFE